MKKWKITAACLLCAAILLAVFPARVQAVQAVYGAQTLAYNGAAVSLGAYNIDGYTYFRLRDLAALFADSIYRFSLQTDEAARCVTAVRFEKEESLPDAPVEGGTRTAVQGGWRLLVDGTQVRCTVYNIGGYNFYRLRDLAAAMGFAVGYDADRKQVLLYAEPLSENGQLEDACFQALAWLYGGEAERGISALAELAQEGCARAAYELAEGYYTGSFGLPQNYANTARYAKIAADGGNPRGQYLYGLLLWSGLGVIQDQELALSQFALAAQAGHIQAQSFLGACLYEGEVLARDDARAAALSKSAADFGDARAAYTYGRCLYHGRGTARDLVAAAQSFETAAQGGLAEAVHALGVCYYEGAGVRFNPYIALYYFELAAGMGSGESAYNAGLCYAEGVGTEADAQKAQDYMRIAAEAGIAQASAWLEANQIE